MTAMRKLLVVLPSLLVLAGGCDSTRRDFSVCDITYRDCQKGFVCEFDAGLCVPDVDAAPADAPVSDTTTTAETPPIDSSVADAKDATADLDGTSVDIGTGETAVADAPQIGDLAIPDTRVPDADGTCSVDIDCVGVPAGAYCSVDHRCVACKASSQCNNDAGVPFCSAQNTCVSCADMSGPDGGSACPASAPVCATTGSCVQCVQNSDCHAAGKAFCVQNQCVGCDSVGATASATDGGAPDGGVTGPCTGAKPVCVPSTSTSTKAGQCVGCLTSADCRNLTSPICNVTSNTCAACTSDTQCSDKGSVSGVCMFHQDGRCATDWETIYVQNSPGTCGTGNSAGTKSVPFCNTQEGVGAVTSNKRLIVMIGPGLFPVTSTSTTGSGQITFIGQNTATTNAGAFVAFHVTVGDVYVRGLTANGGSNHGFEVNSGATLRMDRCLATNSTGGGGLLVHNGAGFEIVNSVFAANQGGTGDFGSFGGVSLGTAGAGLPNRFWFNTIVNNLQIGVSCTLNSQPLNAVLITGNVGDSVTQCTVDSNSVTNRNNNNSYILTADYHLKVNSPCRDRITDLTTAHPTDDIDGQARPYGVGIDCGADEYYP
jgi:hypothetical protein